jgi:hypothetical protein
MEPVTAVVMVCVAAMICLVVALSSVLGVLSRAGASLDKHAAMMAGLVERSVAQSIMTKSGDPAGDELKRLELAAARAPGRRAPEPEPIPSPDATLATFVPDPSDEHRIG